MASERARYSNYVKDQVRKRYHLCRTTADKQALADELEIGSVPKLYNLASRLSATGHELSPSDSKESNYDLEEHDETRLVSEREDPSSTQFSKEDDRYLKAEFGRRTIEAISWHLHHSETAILYRARHLDLRKPNKYWNLHKVAPWFGMEIEEFRDLEEEGIDIYPLGDRNGRIILEVISATSLGRWIRDEKNKKRLQESGADQFFVLEIEESIEDLLSKKDEWERCKFLSHGHVCHNPFAENSFGLFCTNTDRQKAGEDPRCSVRTLAIEDLKPDWA